MTKILLVEDDKSLREIYGVRLLAEGYDIVSAGDGEEALAMAIKERPELIISDVMMPKISGFDMLDILRSTTETKDIHVIMMTALSSEDQRARGQALGADKYLVKSQVGIEDVVRTVHEVLKDAPVAGASPAQAFGGPAPSSVPRPAPSVAPRPTTTPAPTAPSFTPPPAPSQPSSPLPQPTAPFSTARPSGLGERVIHPIGSSTPPSDLASRMDQELQGATNPSPVSEPVAPVAPSVPSTPQAPAPALASPASAVPPTTPTPLAPSPSVPSAPQASIIPDGQASGVQFEEIPRPPVPPAPGSSTTPPTPQA
ncbi:MAG TPA: response regulator [Candidatus Saccharimonadales bacterium]|nr:response regulator [Candidatus Saccharimonadales bacterium]